ncbi:hypothetical protein Lepto7375DRAFT_1863 [Leptolyngbya sp. PCC 7375]|nr:hypothetical protein Lepto7375DRAFT_1863 [Leptolyngbya sp. PCC 7375]
MVPFDSAQGTATDSAQGTATDSPQGTATDSPQGVEIYLELTIRSPSGVEGSTTKPFVKAS